MSLSKLQIKNFQAHSLLEIDLEPGINTIVGPSDVGKSAIIRALRWIATNRPSGEAFIKDGEKSAEVRLTAEANHVLRTRGKENIYGMNGQRLEAFGTEVPEPVTAVLQLSEINFQGQFDSPYWFNDSAPEVSRQLNQIVDLSVMDSTLSNLIGKLKNAKSETTVIQERLDTITEERKTLSHFRKMEEDLAGAESVFQSLTAQQTEIAGLERLIFSASSFQEKQDRLSGFLSEWDTLAEAEAEWEGAFGMMAGLGSLVLEVETALEKTKQQIPDISPIIQQREEYLAAQQERKALSREIREIREMEETWHSKSQEATKAGERWKREMGEQCPLCNQPIK